MVWQRLPTTLLSDSENRICSTVVGEILCLNLLFQQKKTAVLWSCSRTRNQCHRTLKKNIYIYDATGWQDAAFARTVLLLGPLDDEDRAFAVLRAVVADAAQERPARSHTAIRTSDGRVNVKIGGDGKQKIFLLRSLSSRWPWHRFRVIEMDACTPSNEM